MKENKVYGFQMKFTKMILSAREASCLLYRLLLLRCLPRNQKKSSTVLGKENLHEVIWTNCTELLPFKTGHLVSNLLYLEL